MDEQQFIYAKAEMTAEGLNPQKLEVVRQNYRQLSPKGIPRPGISSATLRCAAGAIWQAICRKEERESPSCPLPFDSSSLSPRGRIYRPIT